MRLSAKEVVVEGDSATLPVGIDGEHTVLTSPVVCRSAPGSLRVRVPRRRPGGAGTTAASVNWPRAARLALGRARPRSLAARHARPPGSSPAGPFDDSR
ncbi:MULTISPECIES: hypothetical protein [unclassified Streptomyces]|uniref:hypothetical protein n=1 Tax=unclassified Streptomyces TaxID=2593676 RepID=UPI002E2475C2